MRLKGDVGDIGLWGYEAQPTLQEQLDLLKREHNCVDRAIEILGNQDNSNNIPLTIEALTETTNLLTKRISYLRQMSVKQKIAPEKFTKASNASTEGQQKYMYAISNTQALLYQGKALVDRTLVVIKNICRCLALLQGSENYTSGPVVDSTMQVNMVHLK